MDYIEGRYEMVAERTLEVIAAEIRMIDSQVCQAALQGAIAIGQKLHEAKELVEHGRWTDWCSENLNYSKSQAEKLMRISTEYGKENSAYLAAISNPHTCADLSISKALRLLSVPEDEVENFVNENEIDTLTVRELEEKIKALTEEKETSLIELETQKEELEEVMKLLDTSQRNEKEMISKYESLQGELEAVKGSQVRSAADEELILSMTVEAEKAKADIARMESDIEALKEREKKLKEKVKAADEKAKEELEKATADIEKAAAEKAREELQAEMDKLIAEKETALKVAASAEKKAQSMSNEDVAIFKVKVDDLQKTFGEVEALINTKAKTDSEVSEKWRTAVKTIMTSLSERI